MELYRETKDRVNQLRYRHAHAQVLKEAAVAATETYYWFDPAANVLMFRNVNWEHGLYRVTKNRYLFTKQTPAHGFVAGTRVWRIDELVEHVFD